MMKKTTPFLVGLVFLAGIAVFIYMFGMVEDDLSGGEEMYPVHAFFTNASGLAEQSKISVSGIPVGIIDKISLVNDESGPMARVDMLLKESIVLKRGKELPDGTLINGATVKRTQSSIIGDYALSIVPGIEGEVIPKDGAIPTVVSSSGLEAAIDKLSEAETIIPKLDKIVTDISAITGSLKEVLGNEQGAARIDEITKQIEQASTNLNTITVQVKSFIDDNISDNEKFDTIVGNVEKFTQDMTALSGSAKQSIDKTLKHVESITSQVDNIIGESKPDVESTIGTIKGALAKAEASLDSLKTSLDNVEDITQKVNEGKGTMGKLINDDTLHGDVQEIVGKANDLISSYSDLKVKLSLRSEYNFYQDSFKSYVSLKFQPKADKFYLIELIDDPRGETTLLSRITHTNDPSVPPILKEEISETQSSLKVSMLFAKQWHFFIGRFGLIESSGGIGVDLVFFNQHLMLSTDLFELSFKEQPRLRTFASFKFLDHLMIFAGADDVLNPDTRDYFMGMGVTFTDDDIKALLTVAPVPSF